MLSVLPDALLVRTGPIFSPWDRENFAFRILADVAAGRPPRISSGARISPTYLPDLIHVGLDLLIDGDRGIRHLANDGSITHPDLVAELCRRAGLAPPLPSSSTEIRSHALATERGALMPPLHSALDRFVADCEPDWRLGDGVLRVAAE